MRRSWHRQRPMSDSCNRFVSMDPDRLLSATMKKSKQRIGQLKVHTARMMVMHHRARKSKTRSSLYAPLQRLYPHRFLVAPIVGASEQASEPAFRILCRNCGSDLCYSPMQVTDLGSLLQTDQLQLAWNISISPPCFRCPIFHSRRILKELLSQYQLLPEC